MNEPALIREMLSQPAGKPRSLAVVGLSDRVDRPSHYVSKYMQEHGYKLLPVNPALDKVLGERCSTSVLTLPERPDVVNVFRLPSAIPSIVDEMILRGLTRLWVQQGIMHLQAAERAEAAGIGVVMDRCIMVEHRRLLSDFRRIQAGS